MLGKDAEAEDQLSRWYKATGNQGAPTQTRKTAVAAELAQLKAEGSYICADCERQVSQPDGGAPAWQGMTPIVLIVLIVPIALVVLIVLIHCCKQLLVSLVVLVRWMHLLA